MCITVSEWGRLIENMNDLQQQVLRTDVSGMPLEWIGYQAAVRLISLGQVSYSLGRRLYRIHGGINAWSHERDPAVPVY